MSAVRERPYKKGLAGTEILRRRATTKIEEENRRIADRLRNVVKPVISASKHAAEYEKATSMRKSISLSAQRAERRQKDQARQARLRASEALAASAPASLSGGLDGFGEVQLRSATGLTAVRTARDVRAVVAANRGDALPEWMTSSKAQSTRSSAQKPRGAFVLTHTGAPAERAPQPLPMPPFPL